ncbi:MAG: fibrillarin-like rRNA/tRNA 2'-O-methyltransferase [Candidatus Aenigmatarchaeota archaeon]
MKIKEIFEGVYKINNDYYTKNLVKGESVYGEKLVKINNEEYRFWDHYRSKPAAALKNGLKNFPITKNSKILYLGIASGTTASHFSDIAINGIIYGIEVSEIPLAKLKILAEKRKNIVPILADARKPETYSFLILEKVDFVYCDVAQQDEPRIFVDNIEKFGKENCYGMIAIKSRSIDVTKKPKEVYREVENYLKERNLKIIERVELDPYQKDHAIIVVRK